MTEQEKLYTLQEVANYLKVSRQTIYNYVGAGKLKASKLAGAKEYRVTESEIKRFMEANSNIHI